MTGCFDTHIHLFAPECRQSPQELYAAAEAAGIGAMLMPGVRVADWTALLALAQQLAGVYFAPGLHPAYADQWTAEAQDLLRDFTRDAKVIAIGEIGLDGAVGPPLAEQERVLRAQLEIAFETGLPVLLHARQATGALIAILRELRVGERVGGIWHAFSGSLQVARELVDLGFKVGVGPILLRENARKLPEAVRALKLENLVLETDFPDMADTPETLLAVARRVAELRDVPLDEVMARTTANAEQLFRLKGCCRI